MCRFNNFGGMLERSNSRFSEGISFRHELGQREGHVEVIEEAVRRNIESDSLCGNEQAAGVFERIRE